jgi:hypothetical protein
MQPIVGMQCRVGTILSANSLCVLWMKWTHREVMPSVVFNLRNYPTDLDWIWYRNLWRRQPSVYSTVQSSRSRPTFHRWVLPPLSGRWVTHRPGNGGSRPTHLLNVGLLVRDYTVLHTEGCRLHTRRHKKLKPKEIYGFYKNKCSLQAQNEMRLYVE